MAGDGENGERDLALAEMALRFSQEALRNELSTADTIDLKAVGLATADVAALTIVVSFHRSVSDWWASAVLLGVAALCFFLVMWQRPLQTGNARIGPRLYGRTSATQ